MNPLCMNCKKHPSITVFEGVMICEDCSKMVQVILDRRKKELVMLGTLYRDKLRLTLLEGKLRPRTEIDECLPGTDENPGGVRTSMPVVRVHAKTDDGVDDPSTR